jgi:hypothetical protein
MRHHRVNLQVRSHRVAGVPAVQQFFALDGRHGPARLAIEVEVSHSASCRDARSIVGLMRENSQCVGYLVSVPWGHIWFPEICDKRCRKDWIPACAGMTEQAARRGCSERHQPVCGNGHRRGDAGRRYPAATG